MDPKVSFITAVKDGAKELREMLISLIKQNISEWESIIVDDHSDENLKIVVEQLNDDRLRYFSLPHNLTGIANARNYAVKYAHAEFLLIADGDDINHINRAQTTYNQMTNNKFDVFYSAMMNYKPEENIKIPRPFQPFNEKLFYMYNFISNPSVAYKKNAFNQAGGYNKDFQLSEDYDLNIRLLKSGAHFGYTNEALVDYRHTNASITHKKSNKIHNYIMQTRIKNNIIPFDINEVKKYATKEVCKDILSPEGIRFWKDDRYEK